MSEVLSSGHDWRRAIVTALSSTKEPPRLQTYGELVRLAMLLDGRPASYSENRELAILMARYPRETAELMKTICPGRYRWWRASRRH